MPVTATVTDKARISILAGLARAPVWVIALLCAWGVLTSWQITRTWPVHMLHGVQDFTALYAGGRLVGTNHLYDSSALRSLEQQLTGVESNDFSYVRFPAVALIWKPLQLLPYKEALVFWKALSAAGFIALAWILPWPQRKVTIVATAVSLGAWNTLLEGQDVWLSVLLIAAAIRFMSEERDGAAGIFLGVAIVLKYHLFPLAILVLLVHRRWRLLIAAGGVVVAALAASFAVQGFRWPAEYAQVLLRGAAALPQFMPDLGGVAALTGMSPAVYLAIVAVTGIAVVSIARRSSALFSFGIALFAGVLIAPHGYTYDFTILLPALLPLAARHTWFETHCVWWLMPFPLVPLVAIGLGLAAQIFILITGAVTLYAAWQYPARERLQEFA